MPTSKDANKGLLLLIVALDSEYSDLRIIVLREIFSTTKTVSGIPMATIKYTSYGKKANVAAAITLQIDNFKNHFGEYSGNFLRPIFLRDNFLREVLRQIGLDNFISGN